MTRMTRIFKAALYIPAYHTEGKKNPRHPCHPCLKDYLHAEGEPCSSATLVNYHLSEIKHQIQPQSLIPLLDTDYSRLALWSVLTNRFEATDSRNIEQEGNISGREVGHGVQAILTSARFFGGKYSQEYPVTRRINRKWSGRTLQSCPVKISMIALELRINQTFGTFTGDCIIIIAVR